MNTKPSIVILHGWGRASSFKEYYGAVMRQIETYGYRVFAPDMPGFGQAEIPVTPLTLTDYAAYVKKFLEKHKIKSVVFIGHSFGGRVALKYIDMYPGDVQALVLCGTPGFTPVRKGKLLLSFFVAKIGGVLFSIPGLGRYAERARAWLYYRVGARDFFRAEGAMRETFKQIVSEKLDGYMKRIHVPTLLFWGERDVIVPLAVGKKMQQIIPGAALSVIPGGGHSVIVDDPKSFMNVFIPFLKKL